MYSNYYIHTGYKRFFVLCSETDILVCPDHEKLPIYRVITKRQKFPISKYIYKIKKNSIKYVMLKIYQ